LVASFSPPNGCGPVTGVAAYGHISAAQSGVPAWWQFEGCRSSSLSASFALFDQSECDDPWGGHGMGGIAYIRGGGQGREVLVGVAVAPENARNLSSGRTYAAFKLMIDHQQTGGGSGCAGCQAPVCITLDHMQLGQDNDAGYRDVDLTEGIPAFGAASNV